jgi:hypothetical protein
LTLQVQVVDKWFACTPLLCFCAIADAGSNLGSLKLSQDQQLIAYTMDLDEGRHNAVCLVKDLTTGLMWLSYLCTLVIPV